MMNAQPVSSVSSPCLRSVHERCQAPLCGCSCHVGEAPARPSERALRLAARERYEDEQAKNVITHAKGAGKSDSGVDEFRWEEPVIIHRNPLREKLEPFVAELKKRPGVTARLLHYEKESGASGARQRAAGLFPDVEWQAVRDGTGGSILYGCWIDPDS